MWYVDSCGAGSRRSQALRSRLSSPRAMSLCSQVDADAGPAHAATLGEEGGVTAEVDDVVEAGSPKHRAHSSCSGRSCSRFPVEQRSARRRRGTGCAVPGSTSSRRAAAPVGPGCRSREFSRRVSADTRRERHRDVHMLVVQPAEQGQGRGGDAVGPHTAEVDQHRRRGPARRAVRGRRGGPEHVSITRCVACRPPGRGRGPAPARTRGSVRARRGRIERVRHLARRPADGPRERSEVSGEPASACSRRVSGA